VGRVRWTRRWAAGFAAAFALGPGAPARDAAAASIELTLEARLRDGQMGDFGSVRVEELGDGRLSFRIEIAPGIGPRADLRWLFFDLADDLDARGLVLSEASCNDQGCRRAPDLRQGGRPPGGGSARFDLRVDFGRGSSGSGNGRLETASFVLGGDEALALEDVLGQTEPVPHKRRAIFAANVELTRNGPFATRLADTETVVAVPEPETGALMLLGLAGLASAGARPRR
jgi:hypothetical protein